MNNQHLLDYLEDFLTPERKARFKEVLNARTKYITVAVEDVFKMHNASALIRTCEVFGIQEAHLIESKYGERLDSKIAMGAEKWVDIQRYQTTKDCINQLRAKGYKIIATTPHYNDCLLDDFKLEGKIALFFGTERDGLSPEVMREADSFLKIPMSGFTESLNISKLDKEIDWSKKTIQSIDDVLARYYGEK